MKVLTLTVFFLLLLSQLCFSLKNHIKIKNDRRGKFFIENFGFEENGEMHLTISNFRDREQKFISESDAQKVAFLITTSTTDTNSFVEEAPSEANVETCMNSLSEGLHVFPAAQGNVSTFRNKISRGSEGFYNIYFRNCLRQPVFFELDVENFNFDSNGRPNYLSSGYTPLPTVFGVFSGIYFMCLIIWVFGYLRRSNSNVNRIHHLMTLLVILKFLSLVFKTVEFHQLRVLGSVQLGWEIVYFIFASLKGIMFFILIALIGTGWRFIKPFLSEKDKKIFLVVIPLQIIDNIAMIMIEDSAPGSQAWATWKDIFRLVDIICCGAILIPIIWSIKHLREAAQSDGKALLNFQKLTLFRQFYLMVVSYIYFTRIIVYLVDATLHFRYVWLGDFFSELATLIFFVLTAHKFSPSPDNPYFKIPTEEEEEENRIELGSKDENVSQF